MGFSWTSLESTFLFIIQVLMAGYYDLLYVVLITLIFLSCLLPIRRNLNAQRLVYSIYVGLAIISLVVALLNKIIVPMLGTPFNYQWLYYADFLRGPDVYSAISAHISWKFLLYVLEFSLAMMIASSFLFKAAGFLLKQHNLKYSVGIAIIIFPLLYFPLANRYIDKRDWNIPKLENPIISFFQSIVGSRSVPKLFNMKVSIGYEDFKMVHNHSLDNSLKLSSDHREVRNIIIFVLESVPAEYISEQGMFSRAITPELNKYRNQSAFFNNIYTHAPATNKSLISMLCSIYPWVSYASLTREYPAINVTSLSSVLKQYGYRTGYFNSGDNRFHNAERFLHRLDFDRIEDYRILRCERQGFIVKGKKWDSPNGTDDECIVDSFIEWWREDEQRPFFAMLWTYQTHYPYFVSSEEIDFEVKSVRFNRYLNAVHHIDKALGNLLNWLELKNLMESTLIVVVGDHGEAFGRHNQFGHAWKIYEENVNVPLILISRKLFSGQEYSTVGGLVDLAPTIMDIINIPMSPKWQGHSLFSNHRTGRVYFFSPWSDYLFGYREGDLKFIFNASNNTNEIYDLQKDPQEVSNLAEQLPDFIREGIQRLAAWIQFQDKFVQKLISDSYR